MSVISNHSLSGFRSLLYNGMRWLASIWQGFDTLNGAMDYYTSYGLLRYMKNQFVYDPKPFWDWSQRIDFWKEYHKIRLHYQPT